MDEDKNLPQLPPSFPLEELLGEISEIMRFSIDNADALSVAGDAELNQKLAKLEKDIAEFAKLSQQPVLTSFVSDVQKPQNKEELLTPSENTFIENCERLKFEMAHKLEELRAKEQEAVNKGEIPPPQKQETGEEAIERREKTFKRATRTKNWKQL